MAFNKKLHLLNNIEALQLAFDLERSGQHPTEEQTRILQGYCGFGAFKCVLLPVEHEEDRQKWNKTDLPLFDNVRSLHEIIRANSPDEAIYKKYVNALQESVLTAYYTPTEVVYSIARVVDSLNIQPVRLLDPSAGVGVFLDSYKSQHVQTFHAFENDLLTGTVLKALHPDKHIHIKGFETIIEPYQNYFDMVSSNIPFGNFQVYDKAFNQSKDPVRIAATKTIHTYFFVKSVDCAREGGLIALITSRGLMDSPGNKDVREWLMKNCTLLSAIRLPDNLFLETANTQVGSDLIVLQKNPYKKQLSKEEIRFLETRQLISPNSNSVQNINNYFMNFDRVVHTQSKVGTDPYGRMAVRFYHEGQHKDMADDLFRMLRSDVNRNLDFNYFKTHLPVNKPINQLVQPATEPQVSLYDLFELSEEERSQFNTPKTISAARSRQNRRKTTYEGPVESYYKPGMIVQEEGTIGVLKNVVAPHIPFQPLDLTTFEEKILSDYLRFRDVYFKLSAYENEYESPHHELRYELNHLYNNFVKEHGNLNTKANIRLILQDRLGQEVLGLEMYEKGEKRLADIFDKPVSFLADKKLLVETTEEAFVSSLNKYGTVNLDYMQRISGIEKEEMIKELSGKIYYNPIAGNYEIEERFIAGDVIKKADEIENFIRTNPSDPTIDLCKKSLKVLREAIPEPVAYEDLDFNLGERWIPQSYYSRYASEVFNNSTSVFYFKPIDKYEVNANKLTSEITKKHAVESADKRKLDGVELFSHALINTSPVIKKVLRDENGNPVLDEKQDKIHVPDIDAMIQANNKIEELRANFTVWLDNLPKAEQQELTNIYNRKFNSRVKPNYDGSFLTLPGLQLKNLGIEELYKSQLDAVWMCLANYGGNIDHEVGTGKTLIMCIIAYEMKRLKMANKPLIIGMKANTQEIAETFRLAYPDAKILCPTEEDFKPNKRIALINKIKNNDWDTVIMTHDNFLKIPPNEQIELDSLQNELDALDDCLKVYEEQTGKAASSGMLKGVKIRRKNLEAKQKRTKERMDARKDDVVDFSQLGIDHILVDEYHNFKNLMFVTRYGQIAGLGNPAGSQKASTLLYALRSIQNKKDRDLCATFLSGTPISNSLVELYIILKYLRPRLLEELNMTTFDAWAANFARRTTDYEYAVTGEIKQKERLREFIKLPELVILYFEITDFKTAEDANLDRPKAKVEVVLAPKTPQQETFFADLIEFSRTDNGESIGKGDLTPKEKKAKMLIVSSLAQKATVDMRLVDPDKYTDEVGNRLSLCAQKIAEIYKEFDFCKAVQLVFSDTGVPKKDKWNFYTALKEKLVNTYKIPSDEIRFVHEANNGTQRKDLFDEAREGKIRVLMGSTSKLGTGVNVQTLAIAQHDIDIPWKPSSVDQRRGRTERPGNIVAKKYGNNEVRCFIYVTKNSPDSFKLDLLKHKKHFIDQVRKGDIAIRRIDEGAIGDDGYIPNYETLLSMVTGDDDLLLKTKLERTINYLQTDFKAYKKNLSKTETELNEAVIELEKKQKALAPLLKDWEYINRMAPKDENYERKGELILHRYSGSNVEEAKGKYLKDVRELADTKGEYVEIGRLIDLPIYIRTTTDMDIKLNTFSIQGNKLYKPESSYFMNYDQPTRSFFHLLERISGMIHDGQREIAILEEKIPVLKDMVATPWGKEDRLNNLKLELEAIQQGLSKKENATYIGDEVTHTKSNSSPKKEAKSVRKKSKVSI